jgi:hypothetical protein
MDLIREVNQYIVSSGTGLAPDIQPVILAVSPALPVLAAGFC